ncbi:zinc finger, CCHC-type containing protein [Tanacetum coccineum]
MTQYSPSNGIVLGHEYVLLKGEFAARFAKIWVFCTCKINVWKADMYLGWAIQMIMNLKNREESEAAKINDGWYGSILKNLKYASPLSLKVSLRSTLDECLIREYRLTSRAISCQISSDFCEVSLPPGLQRRVDAHLKEYHTHKAKFMNGSHNNLFLKTSSNAEDGSLFELPVLPPQSQLALEKSFRDGDSSEGVMSPYIDIPLKWVFWIAWSFMDTNAFRWLGGLQSRCIVAKARLGDRSYRMQQLKKDLVCPVIEIHLLIMSGKATSGKITISGEVTSPDNHMFTVDQRLNIMSGEGTSSKKATLDELASAKDLKSSDSPLFLDELQVGVTGTIFVMLCRIWDVSAVTGRYLSTNMVVSNARVNANNCSARSNVTHNFIKLKEGVIYCIKNFVVHPNKEEYRIRKDDAFMLEFNGGYKRSEIFGQRCWIYVARYITNVGRSIQQRTVSRTLDFYLANQRCLELHCGGLGDILIEKKTKDVGQYKLYLSSSSSTQIFDDLNIPALKELRSEISVADETKQIMPVEFVKPRAGTLENLLLWACNHQNDCKKGVGRKLRGWWCGACEKAVEYPVLRLELGISNAAAHVVVVMFDETASELVKCSADSLMQSDEENLIPPEAVVESAGSSTIDAVPDALRSLGKRLCKQPSVSTPLKPCEGKTPIRQDLKDSDADSLPGRARGKKKQRVSEFE